MGPTIIVCSVGFDVSVVLQQAGAPLLLRSSTSWLTFSRDACGGTGLALSTAASTADLIPSRSNSGVSLINARFLSALGGVCRSQDESQPLFSMYVLLFVSLLAYVGIYWINIYWLICLLLVYFPWYLDGKEFSGERRWDWFRRFPLWRYISPIQYNFANIKNLNLLNAKTKRIYVMVPGDTLLALVWGIGLHGGRLPFAERLHYVVPPLLMWIPLLRDVLLWTGAITYHPKKRPLNGILLEMLQSNRSVCYCPSNFANMTLTSDGEIDEEEQEADLEMGSGSITRVVPCLNEEMLKFALMEEIQLVPVVVHGERRRYYICTHDCILKRVQKFFYTHIGYPFPLFFWLRMFQWQKPPPLCQQFADIIECNEKFQNNTALLKETFEIAVMSLTQRELGDDLLKLL
jgi:hypothetical protein